MARIQPWYTLRFVVLSQSLIIEERRADERARRRRILARAYLAMLVGTVLGCILALSIARIL